MTQVWYPEAVRRPIGRDGGPLEAHRINLHTAVTNASSLAVDFRDGPYSHLYVREDGTVEQYVPIDRQARADYHGNDNTISIETWDGYPKGAPGYWRNGSDVPPWTPEQVASLKRLIVWIMASQPQIPRRLARDSRPGPSSWGLSWHRLGVPGYMVVGGIQYSTSRGKVCPGDRRIAQIPSLLSGASVPAPTVPEEDDMQLADKIPGTDLTVEQALRRGLEAYDNHYSGGVTGKRLARLEGLASALHRGVNNTYASVVAIVSSLHAMGRTDAALTGRVEALGADVAELERTQSVTIEASSVTVNQREA